MAIGKNLPRVIMVIAILLAGFLIYRHRETARLNNLAVSLINQERYVEALEKLERASERDPDNAAVQRNIEIARQALVKQEQR